MPYKFVTVQAEKLIQYKGIKIYRTYKNDDIEQGESSFYFVTNPYDGGEDAFDIRKLEGWIDIGGFSHHSTEYKNYVKRFIKKCIDKRKILTTS